MEFSRRGTLIAIGAIGLIDLTRTMRRAAADDPPPIPNFTQDDYDNLMHIETSVPGQNKSSRPESVRNLSKDDAKHLKEAGGIKVIDGDVWKNQTPEERDAHLREIRQAWPGGTTLIITIPNGNVWAIPPLEDPKKDAYSELRKAGVIRPFSEADKLRQPRSVSQMPPVTQSDKHGTTAVVAAPTDEP